MPPKRALEIKGSAARKSSSNNNGRRTARKMNAMPPPGISDENDENQSVTGSSPRSTGISGELESLIQTSTSSQVDGNLRASLRTTSLIDRAKIRKREHTSSIGTSATSSQFVPLKGRYLPRKSTDIKQQHGNGETNSKSLKREPERNRSDQKDDTDDDDDNTPRARSHSHRGYNWNTERLDIKPEDVSRRISYHKAIRSTIEREGKYEEVKFRRGDYIWVLPDSSWLEDPGDGVEVNISDLPVDDWWVATILDCCALDQSERGEKTLGILRVKWMYEADMLPKIQSLHKDWIKRVRAYRFDTNEMIESDHVDFLGIECFGGFANGKFSYLRVTGLEVDDEERMKPEHERSAPRKGLYTSMTGFSKKAAAERVAERETKKRRMASARHMGTKKAARTQAYEMEESAPQIATGIARREDGSFQVDGNYVASNTSS